MESKMTKEEKMELLKKIVKEFDTKLLELNLDIAWVMQLQFEDTTLFSGNTCPICAISLAMEWAEANNIQHLADETLGTIN